jgi:pyridoxal phosphate enzyme (YggS family)
MHVSQSQFADNLSLIKQNIKDCARRSGRDENDVSLIAVSKTRSLEEVKAVASLGQKCFGENTIQDAMTKIPYFNDAGIEWHYIGHLQSKKAGKIPGYFQWIHSVDSIRLAEKLSSAMMNKASNSALNCLVQVNVSGEETKSGLMPAQLESFLQQVQELDLPCLRWKGLMTIGVRGDEQQTRDAFARLKDMQLRCSEVSGLDEFDQLSMGMSADYCTAIEEGATMVRVGTSIFGSRD